MNELKATITGGRTFVSVIKDYARIVAKNAIVILVTTLLAAGSAVAYVATRDVQYTSSATLLAPTSARIPTYLRLATTDAILAPALASSRVELTSHEAAGMVTTATPQGSSLAVVTVTSSDRDIPQPLVEAIAENLVAEATRMEEALGTNVADPLTIVQHAAAAAPAGGRSAITSIALAAMLGLIVGLVLAFLRDIRGSRIRSVKEATELVGIPLVADLSSSQKPDLESLRMNLRFLAVETPAVFAVGAVGDRVSPDAVSGATRRLAACLPSAVLVDFDLEGRSLTSAAKMDGAPGVGDVLLGDVRLVDALSTASENEPGLLPAGSIPPNAHELLNSASTTELVRSLVLAHGVVVAMLPPGFASASSSAQWRGEAVSLGVVSIGSTTRRELAVWAQSMIGRHAGLILV